MVGILKTWTHQLHRNKYLIAKIWKLNQLTDWKVVLALKTMETRS